MSENIRLALKGIWSHRLRSFLTMLGVIIGIASIIAIISTIKGTNEQIMQNLIGAGEILAREKTTDGGGATQEPIPAKDWFLLWKSSQSHYDNITWPEAERMGVGIYFEIRNGEYYTNATVHFGIYANEPLPEAAK